MALNWQNTSDRYGMAMIGLHWLMLLMIIGVYACIELRELYPKGSDPREALGEAIEEAHKLAGKVGYFLIGLHAAAALVHHYIQRDNTLTRILPGR